MTATIALIVMLAALAACNLGPTAASTPSPTPTPCLSAFERPNPVAAENTCIGSTAWQQDFPYGADDAIEGFTAPSVVDPGGFVHLYVSTTAQTYTFAVYRMGYYSGAGGRLIYTSPTIGGTQQPPATIDPTTRMVSAANWSGSVVLDVTHRWVSGVYLIKLVSSDGFMRYTFFIVRNQASHAPILLTLPLLTYQAYNLWGNYSLYRGLQPDGTYTFPGRSYAVSFDRPYGDYGGRAQLPIYDLPLINWLERNAYNVTYDADFDLGAGGASLSRHKLIVVSGHSEYWTSEMRAAVTSARDAGTSLAFFGANDIYWHVRLQDGQLGSNRIVVCYKDATLDPLALSQPLAATVRWRAAPLNQPEASLLGGMYGGEVAGKAPLVLADGSQQFLSGTSLHAGSSVTDVVGGEYDRIYPGQEPAPLTVIATSPLACIPTSLCPPSQMDTANATVYTARSGAKVFDAGTFFWSWFLSHPSQTGQPPSTGVGESPRPSIPISPASSRGYGAQPLANSPTATPQPVETDFQRFTANILAYLMA